MKKKKIIASAAVLLAGIGIYKFVRSQQNSSNAEDNWTTANIPDLTAKVIIVSGANSGIGFEEAKEFARKGAQVILACRSMDKAQAALDEILAEIPDASAEIMPLDLASLSSVRQFAEAFKMKYDRLDVLANNAGIMMVPYRTTEDGFESQFGTNHLGHFALTGLLIDLIKATPASRVVNVSSGAHRFGKMDFDNLMFPGGNDYSPTAAYGRSKLANLLFTYELQRRLEAAGADVIAVAAHPGIANTNLATHLINKKLLKLAKPLLDVFMQSAAMGALPTIRAAVNPDVCGGQYYGPGGFKEQRGYPVLVDSNEASQNLANAQQLWQVSEQLTGVQYL